MAYTNKFSVSVAVAVLFLAVTITPQWTEANNTTEPTCVVPQNILDNCIKNLNETLVNGNPTQECCKDLKEANKTDIECLGSIRQKFLRCDANGGATYKIAASMSLFALVTNLLFLH